MPATIKWSAQNSNVYRAYRIMSSDTPTHFAEILVSPTILREVNSL